MASASTQPQYDVDAYLIRSSKFSRKRTLLVEGPVDQAVVVRVLLEVHGPAWNERYSVDTAEMIKSPAGGAIGNREKVELALSRGASAKITGLVDREYTRFDERTYADLAPTEGFVSGHLFWTTGHSIENAFFSSEAADHIIRRLFPQAATQSVIDAIESQHHTLMLNCASVSLAANETSVLWALRGLESDRFQSLWIAPSRTIDIDVTALRALLNEKRKKGLTEAQIDSLVDGIERLKKDLSKLSTSNLEALCHGHIGSALYWTGIAWIVDQRVHLSPNNLRKLAALGKDDRWVLLAMDALLSDAVVLKHRAPFLVRISTQA